MTICPRCQTRVFLKGNECPSCRALLTDEELSQAGAEVPVAASTNSDSTPKTATVAWEELVTDQEAFRRLEAARPLSDPVMDWCRFSACTAWIGLILMTGLQLINMIGLLQAGHPEAFTIFSFFMLSSVVGALLFHWMIYALRAQKDWSKVMFLRAFKQDENLDAVRPLLRAALPPETRLTGIRPPKMRMEMPITDWGKALLYAGSDKLDLEAADRNWMVRLLASLIECHCVVIDMRQITDFVADEVRLCWLSAGRERCFFLVDHSHSEEEWLKTIREMTQSDLPSYALLKYDAEKQPVTQVAEWRETIDAVPFGRVRLTLSSLRFVEGKVPAKDWATEWLESPMAGFVGFSVMLTLIVAMLTPVLVMVGENLMRPVLLVYTAIFLIFLFGATVRLWRQRVEGARLGRRSGLSPGRMAFSLLLILIVSYLTIGFLMVGGFAD